MLKPLSGDFMGHQRGSIRVENLIPILLILVLFVVLLYKLLGIASISEKLIISGRIQQFQAALDIHFAQLMMTGKQQQAKLLEGSNPLTFYQIAFPNQELKNYLGERWEVPFEQLEGGSWIFDSKSRNLIYKLKQNDLVINTDPIGLRLQWRVKPQIVEENDLNGNGKRRRVESVKLESVYSFYWNQ